MSEKKEKEKEGDITGVKKRKVWEIGEIGEMKHEEQEEEQEYHHLCRMVRSGEVSRGEKRRGSLACR